MAKRPRFEAGPSRARSGEDSNASPTRNSPLPRSPPEISSRHRPAYPEVSSPPIPNFPLGAVLSDPFHWPTPPSTPKNDASLAEELRDHQFLMLAAIESMYGRLDRMASRMDQIERHIASLTNRRSRLCTARKYKEEKGKQGEKEA